MLIETQLTQDDDQSQHILDCVGHNHVLDLGSVETHDSSCLGHPVDEVVGKAQDMTMVVTFDGLIVKNSVHVDKDNNWTHVTHMDQGEGRSDDQGTQDADGGASVDRSGSVTVLECLHGRSTVVAVDDRRPKKTAD